MKSFLILTLVLSSAVVAWAGAEGHGGGAFVCRDQTGQISNTPTGTTSEKYAVELQDLWEGVFRSQLPLERAENKTWTTQFDAALNKLNTWNQDLYQKTTAVAGYVLNNVAPIPQGVRIAAPHDAYSQYVKPNCSLEGVASFDDGSGTLFVDPEIVGRMTSTDYAALMFHESVYKVLRDQGDETSTRARLFTAFMFSSAAVTDPMQGVPTSGVASCETVSGKNNFVLFKQEGHLYIQFGRVEGYPPFAVLRAEVQPRAMPPRPLLQQAYEKLMNGTPAETSTFSIALGLDHYTETPGQELLNAQSTYEKYVFVLDPTIRDFSQVRCQVKAN